MLKYLAQLSCDEVAKITPCENNWLYDILQVSTGMQGMKDSSKEEHSTNTVHSSDRQKMVCTCRQM